MHNFGNSRDKIIDKQRSILQKIGMKLDQFSICYDFSKFGKILKMEMDIAYENKEGNKKMMKHFENIHSVRIEPGAHSNCAPQPKRHSFDSNPKPGAEFVANDAFRS